MEINVQNGLGVFDVENVLQDEHQDAVISTTGVVGKSTTSKTAKVVNLGGKVRSDGIASIIVKANSLLAGAKQTIKLQGSNDNFSADIVDLNINEFGDAVALPGNADVSTGRYDIPYSNVRGATAYQYLRAFAFVNEPSPNSPANSITYVMFLLPNK